MASLGLGAVAEPALGHVLEDLLHRVGLPESWVVPIGYAVAISVVVFLHLVIGEMAPKSWAIAHPERSALMLARPFRAFVVATKPVIAVLNWMANGVVRPARRRAAGRAGRRPLPHRPAVPRARVPRGRHARRPGAGAALARAGAVGARRGGGDGAAARHRRGRRGRPRRGPGARGGPLGPVPAAGVLDRRPRRAGRRRPRQGPAAPGPRAPRPAHGPRPGPPGDARPGVAPDRGPAA